jgi:hypothetical protein
MQRGRFNKFAMTLNDLQRAELACFAARAAGPDGCLEQMAAICYCIRNRVRQGWHDGDWLQVLEHADETAANLPGPRVILDANKRSFQRLLQDVDEIYFSRRDFTHHPSGDPMPALEEAIGNAVYWAFINQPFTAWFRENVIDDPANHRQKANMGLILFYE